MPNVSSGRVRLANWRSSGLFCPSRQVKTGDEGCFVSHDRKVECLKAKAKNFGRKQSQIVLLSRAAIGNLLTRTSHWQARELQNFRTVEVTNFAIQLGMIVERFWRLTFLPSLRLLVASHLAFKICFLAPCLWWESENTLVYFWTSLFSMAPNFPIILPNWAICAWRLTAICFTAPIVTSLHSACAAYAGLIVLQFLVFSAVVGAALFPFLISALKQPMSRWWKRIIALSVSCSAFLRICFISLLKSSPYIVGFLGKFACLCAFLKIWLHLRLG